MLLGHVLKLVLWIPVFYVLSAVSALVWSAMLIQGWLAGDRIAVPDCFLRSIARRRYVRATIRVWAVRAIVRVTRFGSRLLPGVVTPMDAWRLLGLCTVAWALQLSPLMFLFPLAVLLSPVLSVVHVLLGARSYACKHPWYRRPTNLVAAWYHVLRYGITLTEFVELRFHEQARRRKANLYATTLMWLFDVAMPVVLGRPIDHVSDKRRLAELCARVGVRTPRIVAAFQLGARVEHVTTALPPCDLFSKENHSSQGSRGEVWTYTNGFYAAAGRIWSATDMLDELAARTMPNAGGPSVGAPSDDVEILLQERIFPHPGLRGLSSALPTCRIVTVRPPGRASRPLQAMFRMSADPDASVDNFHAGGIACGIDLTSGRLRGAALRSVDVLARLDRGPLDGRALEEVTIPHWSQALKACCSLHDQIGWPPEIGWDVAITADGLVMIEANHTSVAVVVQAVNGAPYGEELYEECLASWLET